MVPFKTSTYGLFESNCNTILNLPLPLSISKFNISFGGFVDRIYPIELEIKDTTDTYRSASYLDLHLEIDSEGRLRTKQYDKRDDFNFPIVNFPAAPAYGIYISELLRYSRACGSYQDFPDRGLLLTRKLLNHVFLLGKLKSSLRKFCDRHHVLVDRYSGVRVTRSLVVFICFVDRCLYFCTFSFGHCIVCSSSIYEFWLPLWYLQTPLKKRKMTHLWADDIKRCTLKECRVIECNIKKSDNFGNEFRRDSIWEVVKLLVFLLSWQILTWFSTKLIGVRSHVIMLCLICKQKRMR
jgi:hypothetical protein